MYLIIPASEMQHALFEQLQHRDRDTSLPRCCGRCGQCADQIPRECGVPLPHHGEHHERPKEPYNPVQPLGDHPGRLARQLRARAVRPRRERLDEWVVMGPEAGARAEGAGRERGDSLDEAGGEPGRGGGREGREEEREGAARGQEVGAGGGEAGDGGRGVRGDGGLGRGEQDGGGVVGGLGEGRGEGEEVAEEGRNRVALQRGVRYPGAVGEAGERRRAGGGGGGHGGAAAGDGSGHWGGELEK